MKTIRMSRRLAGLWLAALRSGKYKQGKGTLYDPKTGGYCCLGVLQMVADGHVERYEQLPSALWLYDHGVKFISQGEVEFGVGHAQLQCSSPYIPSLSNGLATINDSGKYNFHELADLIEANLEYTD
jgi:hypothetical protein